MDVPEGTLGLIVTAEVETDKSELVGGATVTVREGESASTVISLRKQPLPSEP